METELAINEGMQTRSIATTVEAPAEGRTLSGYAIRWNEWTDIRGLWMERFAPGSWEGTPKVIHEHGLDPNLGRKPIAALRSLNYDDVGASYEAELLDAPYVETLMPGLRAGLYGASFHFEALDQEINRRPGKSEHNPKGLPEITVTRAKIHEISTTTFPYYAGSTASVRSIDVTPEPQTKEEPTRNNQPTNPKVPKVHTIEDLLSELRGLRSQVTELDEEFNTRAFTPEARATWDELNATIDEKEALVEELRSRQARLEAVATKPEHQGNERSLPQIARPGAVRGDDIYDLSSVRARFFDSESGDKELRDRALRSVEASYFANGDQDGSRSRVANLLDTHTSEVAKLILTTGSPQYRSAFQKTLMGQMLNGDEVRAMSLTGASGGFAVPYTLDPTVIPTTDVGVNPYRAISRVVQITGDEWRGVTAGAVTGGYAAEATEASDGSPTLTQPTISTEKCQAFVPYSIEIGMDWPSFSQEMGRLIAEFKDDNEATKFTLGSGTNEPFGLLTGATTTTAAAGTAAFVLADLYTLEGALPNRHRARATFLANRSIYTKVRQFDTAGGAALWLTMGQATGGGSNPGNIAANLMGYPAYEASAMTSALTTGSKIAVLGNFDRYVIVDRIGMTVETINHLVGTNHRPTGQRGIYAYWRNGAKVVDANAFRVLVTG